MAAPAKVNLFLGVGAPMPDGYHHLDAVFHALDFHDEVTIIDSEKLTLSCDEDLGVHPEHNLAYRAAVALGLAFGQSTPFAIELVKRIPHGAGLGGGSSDAAAVIAGIAHLWGVAKDDARCVQAAASIGADVPFFLHGGAALMTGRGDVLVRRLPAMSTPVVVVRPQAGVSTAQAYRAFDANPEPCGDSGQVVEALERDDVKALGLALANNFEPVSIGLVPSVGEVLEWLQSRDEVVGCLVAGSGSAVFGLLESQEAAARVRLQATEQGWWAISTRLDSRGTRVLDEEGDR